MRDLTFGEQVKIILSRKGMTIKELAERIQEETGKPMSRQNLTQRLGRDNFQEQDMRMIANILGCPFYLSIFPTDKENESESKENVVTNYVKKSEKKQEEIDEDDIYQQKFIFDEIMTVAIEEESILDDIFEEVSESAEELKEDAVEEPAPQKPERFRTSSIFLRGFGRKKDKKSEEESAEKVKVQEEESAEEVKVQKESPAEEVKVQEEKPVQEVKIDVDALIEEEGVQLEMVFEEGEQSVTEEAPLPVEKEESQKQTKESDFEEEDLSRGEMNPYTGHEYQSNSVRMHPTKLGYVQVYDRAIHGWVEMTEWAFLGYQEKMKKLLGRNYESPIYLD
ncbi:MAG: hypothetical protein U0L05_09060 [Schaedlerella sp.]|nr:hypothetical protein [Schaedlerella sp.]